MNTDILPPFRHGILTGPEIARQVDHGNIEIEPFYLEQVNPASYDLQLGRKVKQYVNTPEWYDELKSSGYPREYKDHILDSKNNEQTYEYVMSDLGEVLMPRVGYLMHTEESIKTDFFVPVLDGKSSLGRLFIQVHATAGYGDPGFNGQYTLEVTVTHPVKVYPGMRFAQIRFHTLVGEVLPYTGNYTGEAAMGPVASKSWRQFK